MKTFLYCMVAILLGLLFALAKDIQKPRECSGIAHVPPVPARTYTF